MVSTVPDETALRDPLRGPEHSARFWTTVNAAEALPGVPTPLNWSWYDVGTELAMVGGLVRIGAEARGTTPSDQRDDRHLGIFWGRAAVNVDKWRAMADAIPGATGAGFERDILGAVRPGTPTKARPDRYPVLALKAARAMGRARKEIRDGAASHRRWWLETIEGLEGADDQAARAAFSAAFADYIQLATAHLVATMAAQGLFDALGRLCARVGRPGLESSVAAGVGTEEGQILQSLWRVARGDGEVRTFLREYGYQGPGAGEIANPSWRANPALLEPLIARYRELPEDQSPTRLESRRRSEREQAEHELLAAVPRLARRPVQGLIRLTLGFLPLRESGRGTILRSVDVARAAVGVIGEHAAEVGRMHRPDDVFMCTVEEVTGEARQPSADELSFRRERWEDYKGFEVPASFQGVPEQIPITIQTANGSVRLSGIGASQGTLEGPVRVVTDLAADSELEPGEILVCQTTDPSWASLFLMASAVVIDIGGQMSHGAIVARELGIPCVINTKDGTRLLRTGDRIRIDGAAGIVERLEEAR
jgi:phosphohistidine swiveling domain-containing protein